MGPAGRPGSAGAPELPAQTPAAAIPARPVDAGPGTKQKAKAKDPAEKKKAKRPRIGPAKPPRVEVVPGGIGQQRADAELGAKKGERQKDVGLGAKKGEKQKEKKASKARNEKVELREQAKEKKLKARKAKANASMARKPESLAPARSATDRKAQAKAKCTSFLMRFTAGRKAKTSKRAVPEEPRVDREEMIRKRDAEKVRIFGKDPLVVSSSDDDA